MGFWVDRRRTTELRALYQVKQRNGSDRSLTWQERRLSLRAEGTADIKRCRRTRLRRERENERTR